MRTKWKLFALANYIILVVYIFLLIYAIRFTAEVVPSNESIDSFMPFTLSLFVIIINSVINLRILHKYLAGKLFTKRLSIVYLASTILSAIAFAITIGSNFIFIYETLNSQSIDNFAFIALAILLLLFVAAVFIIITQVSLLRSHKKNKSA